MAAAARGKEFWRRHVTASQEAGKSMAAYAREHGLSVYALGWWRRKQRLESTPAVDARAPKFVALKLAEPIATRCTSVTVSVGDGVRVQLSELPSPAWLAELSRAMRGDC